MLNRSSAYRYVCAFGLAALAIACGGNASMTGSDAPAAAPGSRGATIRGTVLGAAAAGDVSASSLGTIRVSVVGTSLQAMTDSSGNFTLNGVPPGKVELRFQGSGVDARLTIDGLSDGQTLTLTVRVEGNNASRVGEGDDDDEQGEVEFDGTVTLLDPLTIGGRRITTNSATRFLGDHNDPVPSSQVLKVGNRVEVEGRPQADGSVLAEKIKLEDNDDNDDDGQQEVEFEGTITQLSPLMVGGRNVVTNSATRFLGDHNDPVPSSQVLKVGNRVEVEGRQQADNSVLAEKIKLED